ncbi:ABC transporter ATP-binding protein [Cellulomonas fengjieae]|uniref:ABC transporter ATP-binding protein n=1 Tax=Cellulomonas fengjieae TaxID=2819978 RepID=UPI001AAFC1F9|nr:ABC transporter ATP-binding protein [Cellulomonas fengjieae]MBO3101413.1 ABC transporter ATP-binding protein [Cellulomonas fengjieae]
MSNPTVVQVNDLSKRFVIRKEKSLKERVVNFGRSNLHKEDFWALRDVNIAIESGTTVGLIGPNGSGKSTLLKMIGGILQPTTGTVQVRGRMAALLELGAGFHPDLTGRENVYLNASILGLSTAQIDRYFDAIVDFSGIEPFIDTQVKFYSSGMYVRLAFSVAVHVDPDLLLVDEVLAVGDEPFQRKCMDRIRQFQTEGRTIVLVTHGLDQVAELCDRAIVLEHGVVKADGAPRDALRVLRTDFDQIRADELQRERADTSAQGAEARPSARIVSAQVLQDGQPVDTISVGTPITIRVTVEAADPLESWILGFGFDSAGGQTIYGTNSKLLKVALPTVVGTASFDFDVPQARLGEGAYTVHGAIADASGAEIHRLREAARVHVTTPGTEIGFVHLGATLAATPV